MGKKDWTVGSSAGAVTGGFYAGLMGASRHSSSPHSLLYTVACLNVYCVLCGAGGRLRGLQGAAAGAAVGAAVIFGRQEFHNWRLAKAVERYEDKYGEAPQVFYPDSKELVESKGPVKPLEFPSLLPSSAKVPEDEIERRILARMEELRQEEAQQSQAIDKQ